MSFDKIRMFIEMLPVTVHMIRCNRLILSQTYSLKRRRLAQQAVAEIADRTSLEISRVGSLKARA